MHLKYIQISPELRATLAKAFASYVPEKSPTPEPTDWCDVSRPIDRINFRKEQFTMSQRLKRALLRDGGAAGRDIIDTIDGMVRGDGATAVVLRGLADEDPNRPSVGLVLMEAFRRMMFPKHAGFVHYQHMKDEVTNEEHAIIKRSDSNLHMHAGSHVAVYMHEPGSRSRCTNIYEVEELVHYMAKKSTRDPSKIEERAAQYLTLLQLPIWKLRQVGDDTHYAPIICPNPQAGEGKETAAYCFFTSPHTERKFLNRLALDEIGIPKELRGVAESLQGELYDVIVNEHEQHHGVDLEKGDLLLLDNKKVLHGGGPFRRSMDEDETIVPRHITAMGMHSERGIHLLRQHWSERATRNSVRADGQASHNR